MNPINSFGITKFLKYREKRKLNSAKIVTVHHSIVAMERIGIVVLVFLSNVMVHAQESKLIELKSADTLNVKYMKNQEVRELVGHVHFIQSSPGEIVKIWCDRALRYMDENKIELFGRVKIVRDSVTLISSEGVYFGNERIAHMSKGVRLQRGRMVLTSKYGEYFAQDKRSYFTGDVHVVDSTSSTFSDALTYFENEEKAIAVGNVKVSNSENNVTVFGDSLVHFEKNRYTIVPKNPRMVQIDTSASGAIDTLLVVGKLMEAYQDSSERFIAKEQVSMVRADFSGRCGAATFYTKKDLIILQRQPVIWHAGNQVTGDSIVVTLRERQLRSVFVKGRAMAASRTDSLHRQRYDQLTGRELIMYFNGKKLERVEANRNATSLYYLFDNAEPNGVNRSSGDRITIEFEDGKTDRISVAGGVEGKYFPETMIAQREQAYNLDGFRWITIRPKRRNLHIIDERYE
ncbi:MAG: hypothetical protein HY088_06345 [Ignavibacteriales bacterium]|nr:hypothetical protein [Ignavibacteriales bacterium]